MYVDTIQINTHMHYMCIIHIYSYHTHTHIYIHLSDKKTYVIYRGRGESINIAHGFKLMEFYFFQQAYYCHL